MRTDVLLRTLRRTLVPLVVTFLVVSSPVIGTSNGAPEAPRITVPPPPSTSTTTVPAPPPLVPLSTRLATPRGEVPTFAEPAGEPVGTVGLWYGYQMTMPIVEQRVGWLRVRLPERPNGSTAWVRLEDVALSSTPYRIVISLAETKLTVFKDGFEVFAAPVGIGTESTPTPVGSFFVAGIPKPPPAGYGPVVLDTNGHSEAIESWEGSGDAITSIHGPISAGSDTLIGTTGTRISHGCIRMHEADQLRLSVITPGTPVDIVA
jgi:lipoprotein-anchoring transpeptidase ErfK/SrfK